MKFRGGPFDGVAADWMGPMPDRVTLEFLGPVLANRVELTDQGRMRFDLRERKLEYVLTKPGDEEAIFEESPSAEGWWVC